MNKTISLRHMAQISIFAAVTAVLSQLSFPMPSGVPITLQTLAIALCGDVLGAKRGAAAAGLYLLLGAVGLPVFAQFSGGAGALAGMTGGFLWGFIPMAALCGAGAAQKNKGLTAALSLLGLALCHALGTAQFALVTGTAPGAAFLLVSAPYLVKDIASLAAAWLLSLPVNRALDKAMLR